jgi:hypothetical protein
MKGKGIIVEVREQKKILKGLKNCNVILVRLKRESSFSTKTTGIKIVFHGLYEKKVAFLAEMEHFFKQIGNSSVLPVALPRGTESAEITFSTNGFDFAVE